MKDEKELIKQAHKGDHSALALLLEQQYSFLVKYLIKITLQPSLAEDLAQETMLKAIGKIGLYNGSSKFSSWLITIATRLYIDWQRKKKRESVWRQEDEQTQRRLQWQLMNQGRQAAVDAVEALNNLAAEIRMPIILKHYYGYAYEEIAEMLGTPIGTVKSRIHNGLKNLRKELSENEAL